MHALRKKNEKKVHKKTSTPPNWENAEEKIKRKKIYMRALHEG